MKITLENTDEIVEVNGVPARVWRGKTAAGVECYALITRVAVDFLADSSEFQRELQETAIPRDVAEGVFPARMVL